MLFPKVDKETDTPERFGFAFAKNPHFTQIERTLSSIEIEPELAHGLEPSAPAVAAFDHDHAAARGRRGINVIARVIVITGDPPHALGDIIEIDRARTR